MAGAVLTMPDWAHSLIYLAIIAIIATSTLHYVNNIWGLMAGIILGHIIASAIVSRLPGFWGR